MDSVTKNTPIILSDSNLNVKILRIDDIINEEDGTRMIILLQIGVKENLQIAITYKFGLVMDGKIL